MIPAEVWQNWATIFSQVIGMILSNQITSIILFALVIEIVTNLIYRIASPSDGGNDE